VNAAQVALRAAGASFAVSLLAGCGALTELAGGVVGGVAGGVGGVASAARTVIAPPPATLAPIAVEVVAPAPLKALLLVGGASLSSTSVPADMVVAPV
jgi:hypothetical protein